MATWLVVPLPEWPMVTVPGLTLASASNVRASVKRLSDRVTIRVGAVVRILTGANTGSIGCLPANSGAT